MRGAAAERELAWERGSGASWAVRPRELGRKGGFWAGSGGKGREEEGRLGWDSGRREREKAGLPGLVPFLFLFYSISKTNKHV